MTEDTNEIIEVEEVKTESGEVIREPKRLDIRQRICWNNYVDPKSKTFGSGYRSAIAAGYTEYYAKTITTQVFFKARMRRLGLLTKAEKVFDKTLEMNTINKEGIEDAALIRVQNDTAKFIAKTQGKDEGYTERNELTGKNGEGIVFLPMEMMEKYNLGEPKEEVVAPVETQVEEEITEE